MRNKRGLNLLNLIGPAILILCLAETLPAEENAGDTDPSRVVYLSFREEYYNLDGGVWNNQVIYRSDKAIFKKGKLIRPKGLLLRWDLPFVTTHRGSETTSGLGDLYLQGVLVRSVGRGNVAVGPALVLPTATNDLVGTGKWQLAPLIVPFWYFSKGLGLFLVKAQDFVSFAGDQERPDLHFFLTTVNLL